MAHVTGTFEDGGARAEGTADFQFGPVTVTGSGEYRWPGNGAMRGPRSALIIANSVFSDRAVQASCGGEPMLTRLKLALQNRGNFGDVPVHRNLTAGSFREVLEKFFAQRDPEHHLLLYLSTVVVNDSDGRSFLAASDTRSDSLASTGVGVDFLRTQIERSGSERVLVIADCTYADRIPGTPSLRRGTRMAEGLRGPGRCIMSSVDAEAGRRAGRVVNVLTQALVNGFKGSARDSNRNGIIHADELIRRVRATVRDVSSLQVPDVFDADQTSAKFALAWSTKVRLKAEAKLSDRTTAEKASAPRAEPRTDEPTAARGTSPPPGSDGTGTSTSARPPWSGGPGGSGSAPPSDPPAWRPPPRPEPPRPRWRGRDRWSPWLERALGAGVTAAVTVTVLVVIGALPDENKERASIALPTPDTSVSTIAVAPEPTTPPTYPAPAPPISPAPVPTPPATAPWVPPTTAFSVPTVDVAPVVPDVTNLSEQQAISRLTAAGFNVDVEHWPCLCPVPKGYASGTLPGAGTSWRSSLPVTLFISA